MTPARVPLLLEVEGLATTFDSAAGSVRAVDGVWLSLRHRTALGIVGESGCGKTVLARSIMNLLPRRGVHREGRVRLDGRDLTGLSAREMTGVWGVDMAMVFQDPMTSLNPVVRIGRQITESLRFHLGMSKSEAEAEALRLLQSVRIPEPERRLREYPHQLSGGMRQRVTIAIAIACAPKLLFADEPTTALDVTVQAQILDLLDDRRRELGTAMVLVTHDLGVVAGRTDEIAVMYAGQIVEQAPTPVLFAEMRMPYTEALLRSVPRLTDPPHARRSTIPGRPPDLAHPPAGCRFAPRCAYAQERCRTEAPPLLPSGIPGHRFACWYPVGSTEGMTALARNVKDAWPPALDLVAEDRDRRRATAPVGLEINFEAEPTPKGVRG
ncbi:MAG: ABC transporter ATP-binding protein [Actinobacteria bacterium]|nr:ABC transporter ATP-binding protein [Actinomycetota bacterium]